MIGSSREKRWFRVLKIDRSEPSELHLSEDPVWYSQQEVKSLLQRIAEGNRSTGGLTFVTKAYGIAGAPTRTFVRSFILLHWIGLGCIVNLARSTDPMEISFLIHTNYN